MGSGVGVICGLIVLFECVCFIKVLIDDFISRSCLAVIVVDVLIICFLIPIFTVLPPHNFFPRLRVSSPTTISREVTQVETDDIQALLCAKIPSLCGGRLVDSKTCMYTKTPDEHL